MSSNKKRLVGVIAGVAILLASLTTTAGASGNAQEAGSVKVGTITAIAGFGGIFEPFLVSLRGYVKWANEHGGIKGTKIVLIAKDDVGDPAKNAAAVRQLVDRDKVSAIIGEATPGAAGGQAYLKSKGIASMGGWATDGTWGESNMFAIISSAYLPSRCAGYASDFAKALGTKKVAFIGLDYPGGRVAVDCYVKKAKARGLAIAGDPVFASLTQPDFRAIVSKLMDAGATDFIVDIGVDALIKVVQAGEQLGFKGKIITTGSMGPKTIEQLGSLKVKLGNRIYGPAFAVYPGKLPAPAGYTAQTAAELKNFQKYVPAKYHADPFAIAGWASGVTLSDAVAKVGTSSSALLKYMSRLKNYTAHGLIPRPTYTEVPHPPVRCVTWFTWSVQRGFAPVNGNGSKPSCSSYIDAR